MLLKLINYLLDENDKVLLRPPGAKPESEFVNECIHCGKCAQICPYDSISFFDSPFSLAKGTPIIEARKVPCYVCMKCPAVCPTGALDRDLMEKEKIRMGIAKIDENRCFPYSGVICRTCFDNCPIYREAIVLIDDLYPKVVAEKCIGCGICEYVCPIDGGAIVVESSHNVSSVL